MWNRFILHQFGVQAWPSDLPNLILIAGMPIFDVLWTTSYGTQIILVCSSVFAGGQGSLISFIL